MLPVGTTSIRSNSVSVFSQTVAKHIDPHIYFAWAPVLEASHGLTDSDNFTLMLTDDTTHKVLYAVTYDSYDNGSIFHPHGNWFYTDWQVQDLDVSPTQGDTFTLTLLARTARMVAMPVRCIWMALEEQFHRRPRRSPAR